MKVLRPKDLSPDKRDELERYLSEMWTRAEESRRTQVDGDYTEWSKAYDGTPLESIRTVPFYKASNFVVKLIRMFVDTFVARTLNIVFATKPLYEVEGLPRELKEVWENYLNLKATLKWDHYQLARDLCFKGAKNGTAVAKTIWDTQTIARLDLGEGDVIEEREVTLFEGPKSRVLPFEDFYVYPVQSERLCDVKIKFHRVRYSEEEARQRLDEGTLTLPEGKELVDLLQMPDDAKRRQTAEEAGVVDNQYHELQLVECELVYNIDNTGKYHEIIAVLEETTKLLVDLYYNPIPCYAYLYHEYKPLPREDFFYGESFCQLLGQSQEETSTIHNDRRNNSFIANTVCFKRRSGSLLPNPSTNWYPGKVWDVDSMDDIDVMQIGRTHDAMLDQEQFTFQLAEKLVGMSAEMQGASQGQMKRGIYNTGGTLAMMAEGNQRQDTNIRDVRAVLSRIANSAAIMQSYFGHDDSFVMTLPQEEQEKLAQVFAYLRSAKGQYVQFSVKTSDAGSNREIERANLMNMMQVIGQYGQAVQAFVSQLANPQLNPSLRLAMNDIIKMMKWMATRVLREFDEAEAAELLPDAARAIEATVPGGSRGTKAETQDPAQGIPELGGPEGAPGGVSRGLLEGLSSMVPADANGAGY